MSLFNTLDFWSTRCGNDETYGFSSITVSKLDESEHDKIIVGSFTGMLRVYQVNYNGSDQSGFKPSDLLLETQLSETIIQVVVGKLVSGSRAFHLGVIHPRTIGVHSFTVVPGSTEHGNQVELKLIYEYPLQRYNYQVVIGPFGGVRGRDFLCAVAVDGTLSFFEQETFVFESQLSSFLLPSPITYLAENDIFVTLSADWCIEAYKYQDLVTTKKKVTTTWSYNLGETLLDIQARRYGQEETFLVALSEHNITCFTAGGLLKFVKRLQYTPLCFHCYVNEYNNSLMLLVVSDSGTLFVYEKCTLRWSAKLPMVPLCILRANLGIDGALVLLSDAGELSCCFLGTRPTLFVAPPLENSIANYKNASHRLESLQNEIRDLKINNRDSLSLAVREQEVSVVLKILPYDKSLDYCQLAIELTPSCPLLNVHINFEVSQPIRVLPASYTISTLYEKNTLNPTLEISDLKDLIVSRLEVTVMVCYMGNSVPRFIQKSTSVWPRFILHPCTTVLTDEECYFKYELQTNKGAPLLKTLFQEFHNEQWIDDEAIGFCVRYNQSIKCVISMLKTKYGFNIVSNSMALVSLMVSQLVQRCKNLKSNDQVVFEYCDLVPKDELLQTVNEFVMLRNKINEHQAFLEKLSAQYRLIQRRQLIKLKDKIPSNLSSLQILYRNTYDKLFDTIRLIEDGQKELQTKTYNLQTIIDLTFDLILMMKDVTTENVHKLRAAMNATLLNTDTQSWAERTLANVIYLLRTSLSNSSRDQHRVVPSSDNIISDSSELANVIVTALNRVLGIHSSADAKLGLNIKNGQQRAVSPILEVDEGEDTHLRDKKLLFVKHQKLLKKRRPQTYVDIIADL